MRALSFLALALGLAPLSVQAQGLRVVADLPPVHALVAQVMGDTGSPTLLLDRGADPHNFALRPSRAASLQEADLVVWVGPEMTPWLARALEGLGGRAGRLALLDAPGTFRRAFGDTDAHDHDDHAHDDHAHDAHAHDAHDDHAHDAHDDHDDHGAAGHDDHGDHSHEGTDPHAWLDPANALHWLDLIAAELSARDPANAATYAANAAAARAGIVALDARLAADLAPVQGRPFVVFHDAYGYFAAHYGLSAAGSLALGDAAAPGAGHLQALRAQLTSGGIVCAFPEAQHDPKLLETLVEGTPVRLGPPLDPSGSSLEPGPGLYEALLSGLAQGLRDCLSARDPA